MDNIEAMYIPMYPTPTPQQDLQLAGHACLIYKDSKEQIDVIRQILEESAKKNELCIYILDENAEAQIHGMLRENTMDSVHTREMKTLRVYSIGELLADDGNISRAKLEELLLKFKASAEKSDFQSLKIISENSWFHNLIEIPEKLEEYEAFMDELSERYSISLICQYALSDYEPSVIKRLLQLHATVLYDGQVLKNPYHIKPVSITSSERERHEALQWLENIKAYGRAEKELLEQVFEHHSFLEGFTGMIFYKNLEDRFIWVNDNYVKSIGIPRETLLTNKISELFPSGDVINYSKDDDDVIRTGLPKRNIIERVVSAEGEKWAKTDKIPMFNRKGDIVGIFGYAFDITGEIKLQEALEKSEELYHSVYDNSPLAFGIWDRDFRFVDWNKRAEEMFGWTKDEVLGKNFVEILIPADIRASIKDVASDLLINGMARITRNENITKDGKILFCEWHNTLLHDKEGELVGVISLGLDKTESQRIEKERKEQELKLIQARLDAEAANHAKSQFLANMSHEIRTPMNGLIGMLQLLQMTALDSEQHHLVNVARTSSNSLLRIINDILDYSKIEAQKIEIENIDFVLAGLIDELSLLFDPAAAAKGLPLNFFIGSTVPKLLKGDHFKLRQILSNLIGNAFKFTNTGHIDVTIKLVEELPDRKVKMEFSVLDTGIGIEPDKVNMLFKRFSQVEASTTRKYGGTGLGLAISKGLVEKMNGEIWMTSTEGTGSICSFTCILEKRDVLETQQGHGDQDSSVPPNKTAARLLVAEDDETSRMVVKGFCRHMGLEVYFAENGQEAIRLYGAQDQIFDMILMDINMPVLDGYTATHEIRRLEEDQSSMHIPIIAMTAFASEEDREKCLEADMDDYISKPVDLLVLRDMVEKWTGSK